MLTNYSLTGSNGDTIVFDYDNYVLTGMVGHNIPPTRVRIDDSAGNGGTWRHTKRGVRNIDLAVAVIGTSREDVENKLRRLAKLTQDTLGPTIINANYSTGETLTLEAHYVSGAEGQWGADTGGLVWCRWMLSFQAPQPFWQSASTQSFTITSGNTGRGLLPQLTKLRLSSSQSLGVVSVTNNADVESYPVWTLRGAVDNLVISNGTQSFSLSAIADGETITVDTLAGTVVDDNGTNRYSMLGTAPKLFAFPPGLTNINVLGTDTSSNTFINCEYALRYEVVH